MDQPAPIGTGAVRSSDATFRALFQHAAIGIALVDTEGRPFESNPALQAMLGYTADQLRTLTNSDLTHPEDLRESLRLFGEMINGQRDSYRIEKRYIRQDGGIVWGRLTASLVRDADRRPLFVIAMIEDVTEWKQAEQALREWAITDDLTGLYNRRGFFTLAEQQMSLADRRNAELFVLYADLDGLKQINDTRGHEEGDRVLMEVAGVLRKTFRESDVVARIGGDEFVVLAFEAQPSSAEVVIARLERNLNKLNLRKDRPYRLSLSAGVARYAPGSELSIDELLAQADRSMYERKASRAVH